MDNLNCLREKISSLFLSETGERILDSAEKLISDYDMADKIKGGVAVGFSGGADSVMLLSLLYELKSRTSYDFPLCAIHINHGIRGEEAMRDENFCRGFCQALSIDLVVRTVDVPSLSRERKVGLEEAARDARYDEFRKLISSSNRISCVAVAHNATDNLETVIFNMMRGTGSAGMCGISPMRDFVIRPLLSVSKQDIEQALVACDIPYVVDSTNLSVDYTRNYIRHEVLPRLNRLSPSPEAAAFRMTSNLRVDNEFIEKECEKFFAGCNSSSVDAKELRKLHPALIFRVIRRMSQENGCFAESTHIQKLCRLLAKDCDFLYSLPQGKTFVCRNGSCFIADEFSDDNAVEYLHRLDFGESYIPQIGARVTVSYEPISKISSNVYKFSIHKHLRSVIIDDGLYIRSRQNGDSYRYGNATRKLKKLFNDKKIPTEIRSLIPVVCDSIGIVWVPGFGMRDACYSDKAESVYITIELSESSPIFDYCRNISSINFC